ncbi:MAG: helix-turn-helix transcriptional regulator [Rhodospirillaceae bacterium]|nr:helix-turn-helix transcriptional regulator [Rhodospirillaceae bacterium]
MLSEVLRYIRIFHGLSQIEMAQRLGISNSYLSELENNKKTPSLEIVKIYSDEFNIQPSTILFFSESIHNMTLEPLETKNLRINIGKNALKLLKFINDNTTRKSKNEDTRSKR